LKPRPRRRYTFHLQDAAAEWAGAALSDAFPDGLLLDPCPGGVTRLRGWRSPLSTAADQALLKRLRGLGARRVSSSVEAAPKRLALHGRFPVLRLGRFCIVPKAQAAGLPARPREQRIVLVQGQAFGTGLHESTRLMLGVLQALPMQGLAVLDVGAGSGILGLACLHLGAASVACVEIEGAACAELRENRALNGVSPRRLPVIHGAYPLARLRAERFPLVLGNLVTPLLVRLMPRLAAQTAKGGRLLCSGIHTPSEARAVSAAAKAAGLRPGPRRSLRQWYALCFDRHAP
jgi:ribosomal protein L11 methylase PrmA